MTFNEVSQSLNSKRVSDYFPHELVHLGSILGNCVNNASMIEINKIFINTQLSQLKTINPGIFNSENAAKLTGKVVLGIARPNDKNFNDLLAYLVRGYNEIANQ